MRRAIGDGIPVAAVAVVGVACCDGLPAIATLLGGAVLDVAGGVLVAAALLAGAALAFRAHGRRRSSGVAR